jgi:hypothetical protein
MVKIPNFVLSIPVQLKTVLFVILQANVWRVSPVSLYNQTPHALQTVQVSLDVSVVPQPLLARYALVQEAIIQRPKSAKFSTDQRIAEFTAWSEPRDFALHVEQVTG